MKSLIKKREYFIPFLPSPDKYASSVLGQIWYKFEERAVILFIPAHFDVVLMWKSDRRPFTYIAASLSTFTSLNIIPK